MRHLRTLYSNDVIGGLSGVPRPVKDTPPKKKKTSTPHPKEPSGLLIANAEKSFIGPHLGKILGDGYRVTKLLGRGAEGHIYIAHHPSAPEQTYVAKVGLMPLKGLEYVDGIPADPILREAYVLSHVTGVYFPVFFASGLTRNGYAFLVREHIIGRTLNECMGRNNPLPTRTALSIGAALCDAVMALHRNRYVHGDVKPQNIVITDLEKPESLRLVDFGASGPLHQRPRVILSDADTEGTPAYMAPERTEGLRGAMAADLYSVASVVYEMFAGTPTLGICSFDPREAKAYLRSNKPIPYTPLGTLRPELPRELVRSIERALDRDPDRRGDWVAGFQSTLLSFLEMPNTSASGPSHDLHPPVGTLQRWVTKVSGLLRPSPKSE